MSKIDRMEREASAFAMELLIPEKFLRADLLKIGGIDLESDNKIARLARRYRVSEQLMTIRIWQLTGTARPRSVAAAPDSAEGVTQGGQTP